MTRSSLPLLFWLLNRATRSSRSASALPFFAAASNAFIVGPYQRRNSSTYCAGVPSKSKVNESRANDTASFGTPAAPKRSSTLLSTPQVIGLTKPSGGGGM